MEEEVLKNQFINEFLNKYNKKDWNNIVVKVLNIGLLYSKNNLKKDLFTIKDFDNLIKELENNNIESKKDLNDKLKKEKEEKLNFDDDNKENYEINEYIKKEKNKEEKNKNENEIELSDDTINNISGFDLKYNYKKIQTNIPSKRENTNQLTLNSFRRINNKYYNVNSDTLSSKFSERKNNLSLRINNPTNFNGRNPNLNYDYSKYAFTNKYIKNEQNSNKNSSNIPKINSLYKQNNTDI